MVQLFEKKEPPRVRVLRFFPRRPDSVSDRAAYWLLTTSWARFLTVIAGFYLTASSFFAEILLVTGGVASGQAGSLADALFSSLQALTVFGCGRLAPATLGAKGALVCAVFVGWLALLLVLALVMVRLISLRPFWRPAGSRQPEEAIADLEVTTQEHLAGEQEVRKLRRKVPN